MRLLHPTFSGLRSYPGQTQTLKLHRQIAGRHPRRHRLRQKHNPGGDQPGAVRRFFLEQARQGTARRGRQCHDRRPDLLPPRAHLAGAPRLLRQQGRFDRLLTATDTERAELLKGIFATRFLETARTRAEQQRDTIKDLLHRTQLARRGLFDQPRSAPSRPPPPPRRLSS